MLERNIKIKRWFQNDLHIFYLLQLIVKKYQNSFSIFYAKINRKMIGYLDSKVVLEPTPLFGIPLCHFKGSEPYQGNCILLFQRLGNG